jgi:beta-mannosidase
VTTRADLADGWSLRLVDTDDPAVPAAVRAALPIPASVPVTVHTDLLAAGLIADPYLDRNELELDWVGRVAWVYERDLDGPAGPAVLLFDGLDTLATLSLNGEKVATTENMHRRYEVVVTLHSGPNRLAVRFDSAWPFGEAERARLGPLPNQYPGPFNYLRKMACNFGWDWGPTLVTAGIWSAGRGCGRCGPGSLSRTDGDG